MQARRIAPTDVDGHRETWPVRSKGFKRWLIQKYYKKTDGAPNSEAMTAALNVIDAKAHFNAPEVEVFVRVAGRDGKIFIDMCNDKWQAVEVDETGWRLVDDPPVRFRRASGMLPLPIPEKGGDIQALRKFLNVRDDNDFVLAVMFLLAALRPHGPYPVMCLSGEQGSAKSTFMNILRRLIDPNTAPLRTLPREDRDLFIAANNGYVLAFDNLSKMPDWISDTLCRLATGGGFATRTLYTDGDECLFNAMRPIILNGIEDFVTRPDLGDRGILMTLQQIPEEGRKSEKDLYADFDRKIPAILGALLDGVVHGLKRLPFCKLDKMPRMADFALWGMACETAFWPAETFMTAYDQNRDTTVSSVLEGDLVGCAIQKMVADGRTFWTGNATELLATLNGMTTEVIQKSPEWPRKPRALSGQLRRIATFLRKTGIFITFGGRENDPGRKRLITITTIPDNTGNSPSTSSIPSETNEFPDIPADDARTQNQCVDDTSRATVQNVAFESSGLDGLDGMDDEISRLADMPDIGIPELGITNFPRYMFQDILRKVSGKTAGLPVPVDADL